MEKRAENVDETHKRSGLYGEVFTIDMLYNHDRIAKLVTDDEESRKNDIDVISPGKNNNAVKIECKTDTIAWRTGNLPYELACQTTREKLKEFEKNMNLKITEFPFNFNSRYDRVMAAIDNKYPIGCYLKSTADWYSCVNVEANRDETEFFLTKSEKVKPHYWINRENLNNYVICKQNFRFSIAKHKEKKNYTDKIEDKYNILILIPFKDLESALIKHSYDEDANLDILKASVALSSDLSNKEWVKSYFEPHSSQKMCEIARMYEKCIL